MQFMPKYSVNLYIYFFIHELCHTYLNQKKIKKGEKT